MGAPGGFFWQLLLLSAAPGGRLYELKHMLLLFLVPLKGFVNLPILISFRRNDDVNKTVSVPFFSTLFREIKFSVRDLCKKIKNGVKFLIVLYRMGPFRPVWPIFSYILERPMP